MIDPERVARELFGLDGAATALPGEHDHNFRLDAASTALRAQAARAARGPRARGRGARAPARRARRAAARRARRRATTAAPCGCSAGSTGARGPTRGGDLASLGRVVARVDRALRGLRAPRRCAARTAGTCATRPSSGSRCRRSTTSPTRSSTTTPTSTTCWSARTAASTGLIDFGDVVWTRARVRARGRGRVRDAGPAGPGARGRAASCAATTRSRRCAPDELAVLFELMRARLRMSVAMAARQYAAAPDNDYLLISQAGVTRDARAARRARTPDARPLPLPRRVRLRGEPERAPRPPVPRAAPRAAPGDGRRPRRTRRVLDLGAGMPPVDGLAIGRYDEERSIYTAPEFQTPDGRWRTRHMAVDLFAPAGHAGVRAVRRRRRAAREPQPPGDYGGLLVLAPRRAVLDAARPPRPRRRSRPARCGAGEEIARLGAPEVNGGWEPHLHLQLFTDLVERPAGRRAARRGRRLAQRLPRPEPAARAARRRSRRAPPRPDIAARRRTVMSRGALARLRASRCTSSAASGAHLYDADGRAFLDLVNNVAHVGHCHPRVVAAGRAADGGAEHEHALPARLGDRLRAPARGDAAGPAARLLLRQLRLGGQRPRAAARRRRTPAART